ncbi:MAG: tRNA uracil 4-sulfurtransferase ThiI, partial [Candidatus Spechtbacterales bacterium]
EGRIYVQKTDNRKQITEKLKYVFGITGYVEAYKTGLSMADIEEISYEITSQEIKNGAKTFKIEARRGNKKFEKNSMEINTEIGGKVLNKFSELAVDIHDPDFIVEIEVRKNEVYAYSTGNEAKGLGGLPVGTASPGLLMLSGGIDSPVAGWMMMKRGMPVDAVYFHTPPYTGDKTKEKIIDLCKILSRYKAAPIRLFVVYFTGLQVEISKNIQNPFLTLVSRRFMTEIAQELSQNNEYKALITGESLGQVASQTIENMAAVGHEIEIPIMRPLLAFDKEETIDIAKKIETFKTSILPYDDCCAVFASNNPRTKVSQDALIKLKEGLEANKLVEEALEKMEIYMISSSKTEFISNK